MSHTATRTGAKNRSLIVAGIAAIGASACCVGPLLLLALGISGGWISTLTALEPYRPLFVAVTLVALGLAFRRLYLVSERCEPGAACATPSTRRNQRLLFWLVTVALVGLVTFPWYAPLFLT